MFFAFSLPGQSPILRQKLRTNTCWSLLVAVTLVIRHLLLEAPMVFNSTMSPITKFLLRVFPFWRSCNDCRCSFLQWDQNSLAVCCTRLLRPLQYKSGLRNFPGGGMTTFDFIDKMLAGDNGWKLPRPFIISTVRGREFRIPSTSVISVRRESSWRLFPCVFNTDARTAPAEGIFLSQTAPTWLANRGFLCHCIKSPPLPSMNHWILLPFISEYTFLSSLSVSMKLVPLSEYFYFTFPRLATSPLNARIKSVSKLKPASTWMALLAMQVNLAA